MRGYAIIAKGDEPKPVSDIVFRVPSQSGNGKYVITKEGEMWKCTCPDHFYRKIDCKHIQAVKMFHSMQEKLKEASQFDMPKTVIESTNCKFCSSVEVVKSGSKNTKTGKKQLYLCKNCGKRFIPNEGFENIRHDSKIVTLVLDLYFKGLSQRKIVDHLKKFYGIEISQPAILKMIRRFTTEITQYANSLKLDKSRKWHVDEMAVKTKGEWSWLWNVMDADTRYMLSSVISHGTRRDVSDARRPLKEAKQRVDGKPEIVVTDGLRAYDGAFNKEFYTLKKPRPMHIRDIHFRDISKNNNRLERLNSTVREREKIVRGLKQTPRAQNIIDGFRAYYNFCRPHQALNGLTPAEVSGIGVSTENKWHELIVASARKK
jgi:transposase-like protein